MVTIANQVRKCIERDPYLRKDLARDVISHAKLARWFQREHEIAGTEQAIISALRRWKPMDDEDPFARARELGPRVSVNAENDILAITVKANNRADKRVNALSAALEKTIPVLPGTGTKTVAVEREDQDTAIEVLGQDIIQDTDDSLSLITLDCQDLDADEMRDLLASITHALSTHGLTWTNVYTADSMIHILFNEADHLQALEVISDRLFD